MTDIAPAPTGAAEPTAAPDLMSPELYLLLVDTAGWTPDAYEALMATLLERTLPRA